MFFSMLSLLFCLPFPVSSRIFYSLPCSMFSIFDRKGFFYSLLLTHTPLLIQLTSPFLPSRIVIESIQSQPLRTTVSNVRNLDNDTCTDTDACLLTLIQSREKERFPVIAYEKRDETMTMHWLVRRGKKWYLPLLWVQFPLCHGYSHGIIWRESSHPVRGDEWGRLERKRKRKPTQLDFLSDTLSILSLSSFCISASLEWRGFTYNVLRQTDTHNHKLGRHGERRNGRKNKRVDEG